jgi:hypothetical protein
MDSERMNEPSPLPFRPLIFPILLLLLGGWGGVVLIVFYTQPTAGWRWLFFFCWVLAWSGSALPFLYLFHHLFPSPAMELPILGRQALWVGIYAAFLAWLQLGRLATLPLALEIATVFVAMEWLLRWREQAAWRRAAASPEQPAEQAAISPDPSAEEESHEAPVE